MRAAELRDFILKEPFAETDFPFGPETQVFRVKGKIFAIMGADGEATSVSLKCDPDLAVELRRNFPEIIPGYHLNKRHWNSVSLVGKLPDERIKWLVDHSWEQVVKGLPARLRQEVYSAIT